jgi:hypothetical protein
MPNSSEDAGLTQSTAAAFKLRTDLAKSASSSSRISAWSRIQVFTNRCGDDAVNRQRPSGEMCDMLERDFARTLERCTCKAALTGLNRRRP